MVSYNVIENWAINNESKLIKGYFTEGYTEDDLDKLYQDDKYFEYCEKEYLKTHKQ